MKKDRSFYIQGAGWISSFGYGMYGSEPRFSPSTDFKYPDLQEYIPELPQRFGRFDIYTKVCFSAAVLALKDAGLQKREEKENIGIVVGSRTGVYDNDIAFLKSTQENNGAFASPNLFSYTLPNVALGEIAVFFRFIGPAFCTGNNPTQPGMEALSASLSLLESNHCSSILVGWVEAAKGLDNKEGFLKGAAFALLSTDKNESKDEFSLNQTADFSELMGK